MFYLRRSVLVIAVWGDDGKAIGMWENEIYSNSRSNEIQWRAQSLRPYGFGDEKLG